MIAAVETVVSVDLDTSYRATIEVCCAALHIS
jgi:hypothetical protein